MPAHIDDSASAEALSRYIDRFLFAAGWRVTGVQPVDRDYEVTLTKTAGPGEGKSVSRRAASAGGATFMACGLARKLELDE